MPLFPLRRRLASPFFFLFAVGVAIAGAEYWMRRQLPKRSPESPKPATAPSVRRAPARRRHRTEGEVT